MTENPILQRKLLGSNLARYIYDQVCGNDVV